MPLIFLGPPGAGKGTQAKILAQQGPIAHISTGDILREAIAFQTSLGKESQAYVYGGELVPDSLIMGMLRERLSQPDTKLGWVLDGFPRNLAQAQGLDRLLSILSQPHPQVVYFDINTNVLVERLLKRGRKDDNEETIRRRLEVYQAETALLIDFYQRRKSLVSIDGNQSESEVTNSLHLALQCPVSA